MKKIYFLIVVMFLSGHLLMAQSLYLPVSSTSEPAREAYFRALASLEHANLEQYTELMDKAIQEDPNFFMAYAHRATGHTSFKQYDKAQEFISRGLETPATNLTPAEQIMRNAMVMLQKSPEANPIAYFDELVATYPKTVQAYDLRATVSYWISGDKNEALKDIRKMIRLSPQHAGGQNMLGYSYMDLDKMKRAKRAFEAYIRLAPDQANPYDSMGDYYMKVKDYETSAKFYEKAASMGMIASKERAEKARSMIGKKE
jgi:tetratricopeptide (TPR) repeat protein